MASIRAKLYSRLLRRALRSGLLPDGLEGLELARGGANRNPILNLIMGKNRPGAAFKIGAMDTEWVGDENADRTLLYLHGGGYVLGSIDTHRSMVTRLCKFAGIRGLIVDYRLAPEHPYPSAIEDAELAYDYLTENGVTPEKMLLAGDSAGGGLSLALMQTLREHGKAQPKAVALLSPWTDLTISGRSHKERAERDPMIDVERMPQAIDWYCPNQDKKNPLISPVFADLAGFPPMFVQVGSEEVLFDDSTRLVENAEKANVEAELQIWPDMPHVHQIAHNFVPEAKAALRDIAGFFNRKGV
ncbi:MAG: alpha/beta hydrolase [Parvibaculales bacterium]